MFCKKCGKEQGGADKFCRKCGTPQMILGDNIVMTCDSEKTTESPKKNTRIKKNIINTKREKHLDLYSKIPKNHFDEFSNSFNDIKSNAMKWLNDVDNMRKLTKIIAIATCVVFLFFKTGFESSFGWWVIIGLLLYTAFIKKKSVSVRNAVKETSGELFICIILSLIIIWGSPTKGGGSFLDSTEYDTEGYIFAKSYLKSPSSATLLSYATKKEMREKLTVIKLPKNLEVEVYLIEAQNSFGGYLQKEFAVFFWKGKPIHTEEDGLKCFTSYQNWNMTKAAIKINTGIDVDK